MEKQQVEMGQRIEEVIRFKKKNDPENQSIIDFLSSLANSYHKFGRLTEKQERAFERIENFTRPEVIRAHNEWAEEYREKYKKRATIIAKQYQEGPGPYYENLSRRILEDEEFVPSRVAYQKMCDNKYADKAHYEITREPEFSLGSLVLLRDAMTVHHSHRGKMAIVVKNDYNHISSFAKGSKKYRIAMIGKDRHIFECEERHIKREISG
tara:strand:+ start:52 stop:681 length:630 start_codon:yes stop_codon:yes gene_type:complete